ncbi:MAG TPA: hypothetical protein VKK61_03750 [Tepidisphaeraceae bacterium]|nr:hypothetical protein [Tepidisphaeraceae bacterium]
MKPRNRQPHGIAALLVLAIVALASLIGMAMLASASLQADVSNSAVKGAAADYLASSAMQAGSHYLQYPAKVPSAWVHSGYLFYVTGATISGVSGSFDLNAVATSKPDTYQLTAIGYSGTTNAVTRTMTAQIQLQRAMPSNAGGFGTGTFIIPSGYTFNGPVLVNGILSLLGVVTGAISQSPKATDFVVPSLTTINYYGANIAGGTYTMPDGTTGTPQLISGPTLSSQPAYNSTTNPGKVFYINGPLTISAASGTPLSLSGTYIVRSNALTVKNSNSSSSSVATATITPQSGFPALIVDNKLTMSGKNISLIANGVVWTGSGISWSAGLISSSSLTINGSLLLPAGATLGINVLGGWSASINYDPSKTTVNNLTTSAQPQPITSVKYQTSTQ